MSEPTKRTFDEIHADIAAINIQLISFEYTEAEHKKQIAPLLNELKGLSDDKQESTD